MASSIKKWWQEDWTEELVIMALIAVAFIGLSMGTKEVVIFVAGAFAQRLRGKGISNGG